jgi:hypothetical protein
MKRKACLFIVFACTFISVFAQTDTTKKPAGWLFNAAASFYFIPHDFFVLPVFRADKNKLHLEVRYNYEDRQTFSGWIGYNFEGGNKLEYTITPEIGVIIGNSNGIAPGVETTLGFKNFELYSESEYFFDFESTDNFFLYTWTDITYSPIKWLSFGISAQRSRIYKTPVDIQRGILGGVAWKRWKFIAYGYNLFTDDPFLIITISKEF